VDHYQESAVSHNFNYTYRKFQKFGIFSGVEESILDIFIEDILLFINYNINKLF